jgi:hypothetical protein
MQSKCIVFDLDHTIGYFKQFIQILNHIHSDNFIGLFDLFPEYFRPNIFQLFEYLIIKRKEKKINKIILYTNNNNDLFINRVVEYINQKLSEPFFDIIITPTHPYRSSKYKDYNDLIKCSNINSETNICFIDDKKHLNMICENVFYIRCEPYIYNITPNELYNRIKIKLNTGDKNCYMLNLNNQKRVTEQIFKRIQFFIKKLIII